MKKKILIKHLIIMINLGAKNYPVGRNGLTENLKNDIFDHIKVENVPSSGFMKITLFKGNNDLLSACLMIHFWPVLIILMLMF